MQGIEFTEYSARAIRAGRKIQTRRVIRELAGRAEHFYFYAPTEWAAGTIRSTWWAGPNSIPMEYLHDHDYEKMTPCRARYGVPGDMLYVREPWRRDAFGVRFKSACGARPVPWKPGRFLREADAGIVITLTDVRVERLNAISPADAIAEGVELPERGDVLWTTHSPKEIAVESFAAHWNHIHAHDGFGWTANPYVFVYTFRPWNDR